MVPGLRHVRAGGEKGHGRAEARRCGVHLLLGGRKELLEGQAERVQDRRQADADRGAHFHAVRHQEEAGGGPAERRHDRNDAGGLVWGIFWDKFGFFWTIF